MARARRGVHRTADAVVKLDESLRQRQRIAGRVLERCLVARLGSRHGRLGTRLGLDRYSDSRILDADGITQGVLEGGAHLGVPVLLDLKSVGHCLLYVVLLDLLLYAVARCNGC